MKKKYIAPQQIEVKLHTSKIIAASRFDSSYDEQDITLYDEEYDGEFN